MAKKFLEKILRVGFEQLIKGERGAAAIEYALIGAVISITIVASATAIGTFLTGIFATVAAAF